eukprot:CAMPEP_0171171912 /NCGR_PEP_ID=MMETSP0790-20130122/9455_1 /TAXON_ID=2925 /ORGANISM="Alexandrium catenella, Strain OF101" /LENGTH=686 /DNA_ID=CAMNT_0011636767 /DNA_START=54 /DNA_END=2114 /DNA_ORIENTATION=+
MRVLALVSLVLPAVCAESASPIDKVLQLLSDLQAKVIGEGEEATKTYTEFSEWCEERSKNLGFEIKTGKAEAEDLKASIDKEAATISSLEAKLDKLAADTATDEADLKAATKIRDQEAKDFSVEQAELAEVIDTLQRAVGILEKEMQKGGASMMQLQGANSIADALGVLVDASALTSADAKQLTALIQSSQQAEDGSLGAPAATVYEGQSGGIVGTLEDLHEKAEEQLGEARKKETNSLHNFELLKQSLEDAMKYAAKELAEAKQGLAASGERKATSEGDLKVTSGELKEDTTTLADLHHNCMTKAEDFEAETKSRSEELKALAEAKKVISEMTAGAGKLSYGLSQVALVQLSRTGLSSGMDLANFEAVRFIRDLAHKQQSTALAQLAARIAAVARSGAHAGEDPFGKVKGLIADMIERLEAEADADATHKAYCDKEMAETHTKKDDKTNEIEKLSTKIDQLSSRSAQLKAEVASLEKALSQLIKAQAEMDKLRRQENEDFVKAKADMDQGLEGVKLALKVLRDYYAKDSAKAHLEAEGAGGGIIGLLEVVESDFQKGLIEMTSTEESAAAAYEKESKENEIEKATKEHDVKYKSKETSDLDQAIAEASNDRSGVQSELDAVMEYLKTLEDKCVAKAETFEERKARFAAELAGLKQALKILDGEAMLLQRGARRTLRGVSRHEPTA